MITDRQKKLYQNILLDVLTSGIDIKYEGFIFKSLNSLKGELKKKIKAYHIFFKSISKTPLDKNLINYSQKEFNLFLDEIRFVLSENKYVLKIDIKAFSDTLQESKKSIDFKDYLK